MARQSGPADQARALMEQAQKKLTTFSFFGSKTQKSEDAAELYKKAANLFKVAKQDKEAAESYNTAADCFLDTPNNAHEAAGCFIKAAGCYKKENFKDAATALEKAIGLYTADGRFSMAAKYEKEVAEVYEENRLISEAISHYETAARYFETENSPSSANSCMLKVAHFAAEQEDYAKAVKIFEDVARASMSNKLLQYSVKDYLFKAGLCNLAAWDLVEAKKALNKYLGIDPNFQTSREYKFLNAVTEACENRDEEVFDQTLEEFSSVTPFDNWKNSLLSILQDKIKKNDEDSDGVL